MKEVQIIIILFLTILLSSCNKSEVPKEKSENLNSQESATIFNDVAKETGLIFTYNSGTKGDFYSAEIIGGGAALFDCDNDGDLDVLFNQGTQISKSKIHTNAQPILFRNELYKVDGAIHLSFTNITQHSGIQTGEYGMGIAVADVNNDGLIDVYLTNFGKNRLLKNIGNCQFDEVENQIQDNSWSVSASFFDSQADGFLDLFVGNYVNHSNIYNKVCNNVSGQVDYCGPKAYRPVSNTLWKNIGKLTFENISESSGINLEFGGALGVVVSDFNQDNLLDVYVANDQRPNLLWKNAGDNTFTNVALINGCAVNSSGLAEASMGVDLGDVDNDGDFDLFMTHLRKETNTFFEMRNGQCFDKSNKSELAAPSVPYTGFGAGFIDFDNDGDLDVFVANGDVERISEQMLKGDSFPLKQKNQLYENTGNGYFKDISLQAGKGVNSENVSRGAAFGDIDNDGDTDILVININDPAQLFINTEGQNKQWIGFDVIDEQHNRSAIGAKIEIIRLDGTISIERIATDGSYAVANDPRVIFGLEKDKSIKKLTVYWLTGDPTTYENISSGHYYRVTRTEINVHHKK